jgi:hypothetical protein
MKLMITICLMIELLACQQGLQPEKPVSKAVEGVSFVDAFLRLEFASHVSNGVPLVINHQLSIGIRHIYEDTAAFVADLIKDAERQDKRLVEAVKGFVSGNTGMNTIAALGELTVKYVVLTEKQETELFQTKGKDGWDEFYKIYPKSPGIITLSRPGFSMDGNLAVIYMGNQTHWLAGHGRIHVFQREDGKWVETEMRIGPEWVS